MKNKKDSQVESITNNHFKPLLEFDLDASHIDSHWEYCTHIANFVARMVSQNRTDPFMYSNLLSTSLNELLETVYRTDKEPGQLHFCILRDGDTDRIELSIPCPQKEQEFFTDLVDKVYAPDATDIYLGFLFAEGELDRRIGIYELALNYDAQIEVNLTNNKTVQLIVDVTLNETH
ncbi:MAG: hypothetical protein OXE78_01570 [Gammaproteobacteria bacterium]|nr:hypothetical protein [Gammaproteobacteria bacterium]MCY4357834.1 hypothetical protein [Gammaproteobacteria bacterium]